MGYFDAQFITDKGTELLARSTAGEGDIIFTSMHTGDGEYSLGEISSITSVDGLKGEKGIFPISDVDSKGENTRVRAIISNQDLDDGYYIKEIGLYAKMGNEAEVLFSISVCREKPTFLSEMQDVPIELPVTNYVSYSGDGDFTMEYRSDVYATLDMVQRLSSGIQNNINTVKEGILDTIQEAYENANQFALTKIAELVNGAPTTMDTLKEIADVIAANKSVVDALDTAIGSKANQAELDTHTNNNTIHLTASDRQQFFRGNVEWGWRNPEWTEDVNGWVLPGCYGVSDSCIHLPPNIASPWGNLLVFPSMEGRIVQIYNDWNQPDELYYRYGGGTAWSGWKLMSNHSYAVCLDQPGTAAKTATSSNFCLRQYHRTTVYFVNGSNAISTLQINNDAARRVYYKAGGFDKTIPRGCFIDMIYIDGAWYVCGGVEEPANSVASMPVKCTSMPSNLKSVHTKSDFSWSSDNGYGSVAGNLNDSGINSSYVQYSSIGSDGNASGRQGYRILKDGYYWLRISSFSRTISPGTSVGFERVKRVRLDAYPYSQSSGESIMANSMRATPWEGIQCHTIAHLAQNCIIVPVLQIDPNGSTVISGTFDYSLEIMPLFVN